MGRLSSRLQVMELSDTRKLSDDEQEAGVPVLFYLVFMFLLLSCLRVVVRPYVQTWISVG